MPKRKRNKEDGGGGGKSNTNAAAGGGARQPPQGHDSGEKWSKSKKKRMRAKLAKQRKDISVQQRDGAAGRNKKQQRQQHQMTTTKRPRRVQDVNQHDKTRTGGDVPPKVEEEPRQISTTIRAKSALQQSFLARLSGSRFRELNEDLYTTTSDSAFKRFQENPELFDQYHKGFRKQVSQWPTNPVDVILRWIRRKGREISKNELVVADFGCGDAKLGQKLVECSGECSNNAKKGKKGKKNKSKGGGGEHGGDAKDCQFKVHSFDFVSNGNPLITPCDMSNVPLKDSTVDIGVFCLALMGTNIADFIREAHRVLRPDGLLKIAEVRSRFEAKSMTEEDDGPGRGTGRLHTHKHKGTDDRLLNGFLDSMVELGFECTQKDRSNKMFVLMEFVKTGERPSKEATFTAKPCIYKRR